jgi:hypothetical protein
MTLRRLLQPNLIRRAVAIAIGGGRVASTGFPADHGGTPIFSRHFESDPSLGEDAAFTRAYHEFWDHDQAATGADWVDTGVTITQLVGAGIYRVSAVVSGLTLGQALRLGDTAETAFDGYWPTTGTPSDYLKIAPHVSAAVGSTVWKTA